MTPNRSQPCFLVSLNLLGCHLSIIMSINPKPSPDSSSHHGRFFVQAISAFALLVLITLLNFGNFLEDAPAEIEQSEDVTTKYEVGEVIGESPSPISVGSTEKISPTSVLPTSSPTGAGSYFTDIVKTLEGARDDWIESVLYEDYGKELFNKVFYLNDDEMKEIREQYEANNLTAPSEERMLRGIVPVSPSGISTMRLRRKLKIKFLQQKLEEGDVDFIWATGGHSAAAGHGNLYNESYTAFLEQDLSKVLPKIGWNFEARKYAMGGMGSAPELSLCMEQVYGNDFDFISWDFGMTDGGSVDVGLYLWRANLVGNYPVLFLFNSKEERESRLKTLEDLGAAGFTERINLALKNVPISTPDNVDSLPKMAQYFHCMDGEKSNFETKPSDFCGTQKYSNDLCTNRKYKASWHPGFKWHSYYGRFISLFLINEVIQTAIELATLFEDHNPTEGQRKSQLIRKRQLLEESNPSPKDLLMKLVKEEKEQYQQLLASEFPITANTQTRITLYCGKNKDTKFCNLEEDSDFDQYNDTLVRGRSICHTALLPSQTRYLGYLLNKDGNDLKVGGPAPLGNETYDVGEPFPGTDYEKREESVLQLIRSHPPVKDSCPVTLAPDYKDYFYAQELDGWAKLRWPNKAEKEAYSYDAKNFKGLIGLSFITCDWDNCPEGYLGYGHQDFDDGKFEITINGEPVTKMFHSFSKYTYFLKGEDGFEWKPDPKTQDYEIAIRVKEAKSFVKIGTIYLF